MIRIVADNYINAEDREAFLALAREIIPASRAEEGNVSYTLCQHTEEPEHLVMLEEWKDMEAVQTHMNSEHFTRLIPQMGEFMSQPPVINVYEVLI